MAAETGPVAIEIGLNAAIVAMVGGTPHILTVADATKEGGRAALPLGRFDPAHHRTFETGLRASVSDELLSAAIDRAIGLKPKGHDFIIDRRHNRPSVSRHMSVTGG